LAGTADDLLHRLGSLCKALGIADSWGYVVVPCREPVTHLLESGAKPCFERTRKRRDFIRSAVETRWHAPVAVSKRLDVAEKCGGINSDRILGAFGDVCALEEVLPHF